MGVVFVESFSANKGENLQSNQDIEGMNLSVMDSKKFENGKVGTEGKEEEGGEEGEEGEGEEEGKGGRAEP